MSVISDKLKSTIDKVFSAPKTSISKQIDGIIKNVRLGKSEGKKIKEIKEKIEPTEKTINQVKDAVKTVKSVQESLEAAKIAAEATEKANTIASALNPAAAAIAFAQAFIVTQFKKEIEEAKNALNVVPKLIENFETFINESKEKLIQASEEYEEKKRLTEQRKNNLSS